jgi:putative endonuclease
MGYFVYILYSESLDTFYKGQSSNIQDRIRRHNLKQEKATQNGSPWILIWSCEKPSRSEAVILEHKLKNLTRKRLIEFILKFPEGISGTIDALLIEKCSRSDADRQRQHSSPVSRSN